MRLERNERGDWMLDPTQLHSRLMINPGLMRQKMRLGLVTSRIEKGVDADIGRSRVTIKVANSNWEGIFDEDGYLINERIM
ncbi:DUF6522 family protein [Methylobacterium longum]|uniref:DUF6522 family protein n=1 Tax=Methylobacterium longum TaxID=767694 RepID=A0ABT8AHJ0_9HYPH|nr:DUF6522 family protein [Methylobacterium longum]MDN3569303.1 DUF6522 family protein [Methylobacterium longum]GJE14627.1 hypothetical protein FOHLNKBM_5702 [Methylobacterium longum]